MRVPTRKALESNFLQERGVQQDPAAAEYQVKRLLKVFSIHLLPSIDRFLSKYELICSFPFFLQGAPAGQAEELALCRPSTSNAREDTNVQEVS